VFDVTDIVADIYDANANYGFMIKMTAAGDNVGGNGVTDRIVVRSSESTKGPRLVVDYQYNGVLIPLT
ncbi:hypothetical protein LCGC14_2421700, partial [marine sediment metagenome]